MIALFKTSHLKVLKSPALWISIIFIVFFMSFAPKSFSLAAEDNPFLNGELLSKQVAASIVVTGLIIVVITTFIETFVKIKGSLIYNNLLLSGKPKWQFYFATLTPVFTYSMVVLGLSLALIPLLDSLGLLNDTKNIMVWSEVQWALLIWAIIITIVLGISISLLLSTVISNLNVFTSVSWGYLFLIFFFGGSSVPIFLIRGDDPLAAFMYLSFIVPNSFSNFLFVNAFSGVFDIHETMDIVDLCVPVVLSTIFILARQGILFSRR